MLWTLADGWCLLSLQKHALFWVPGAAPRAQIWGIRRKMPGYKSISTGSPAMKGNAAGIVGGSVCFQLWSMALIKEGFFLWFREPLNIVVKYFLSIKGFHLISACSQLPVSLGELCTWIASLINMTLFLMPCTFSAWLWKRGALQWKHHLQPIRDIRSSPFALVMEMK